MSVKIYKTPQRNDAEMSYTIQGEGLTINGENFDLSDIVDKKDIPSEWILNPVFRDSNGIHVQLLIPYKEGENPVTPDLMPEQPVQRTPRRVGTFREFMGLFSDEEKLALASAAMHNAQVKLWYDTAMGGPQMSLDHPHVTNGLEFMVSQGLLTQERADAIAASDFDDP